MVIFYVSPAEKPGAHFCSSLKSTRFVVFKLVPLVTLLIGGDEHVVRVEYFKSSFDGDPIRVSVSNFEKVIVFNPTVEIVDNDESVLLIAVPPHSVRLVVGVSPGTCCCEARLARTRRSTEDNQLRFINSRWRRVEDGMKIPYSATVSNVHSRKFSSNVWDRVTLIFNIGNQRLEVRPLPLSCWQT